jgi:hypothetical protein
MQNPTCFPPRVTNFSIAMTGAAIVRWESGRAVVLAVHGAFDGSSAWALRLQMEESPAQDFIVDLTHAVEACDFAASLLASWARRWSRLKRVRFRPGSEEHARILAGHGLELDDAEETASPALADWALAPSATGVSA